MSLRDTLIADMKAAMRARDSTRLEAIRFLRAAVQRREVDEQTELDDAEIVTVIRKLIKQSSDAIEQFERGGRADLTAKERDTIDILKAYLPAELDAAELDRLVSDALSATGAASAKDIGKVMVWLKPRVHGRADMGSVSAAVRNRLAAAGAAGG